MTDGIDDIDPIARSLALLSSERDAYLDALDELEAIVRREVSFMSSPDQGTLTRATELLAKAGRRKLTTYAEPRPPWTHNGNGAR